MQNVDTKILFAALFVMLMSGIALAQGEKAIRGTGLEVPSGSKVWVLVEGLKENAKEIGLSKEHIKSKVELQLRKNGIEVAGSEDALQDL